MCFGKLLGIFKKPKRTDETTPPTPNTPVSQPEPSEPDTTPVPPLTLPHPEAPMDPNQTVANTPVSEVFQKWYDNWSVPAEYWEYWKTAIDVQVYDAYPQSILNMEGVNTNTPGVSWESGGKRHFASLAPWFNPGVTAHEQAHNSYSLLNDQQKSNFSTEYRVLRNSDPLMILMFRQHSYAAKSDVEAHAEIYRYLGEGMPAVLKQYYPKLF